MHAPMHSILNTRGPNQKYHQSCKLMGQEIKATQNVALIIGVTGLVGKELARSLTMRSEWKVYGIARRPDGFPSQGYNYYFISCDLLDPVDTMEKLSLLEDVTHIFWVTWASQFPLGSKECCDQNQAMMSNVLNAILPRAKALKHVSLQTGTKHYIPSAAPFDSGGVVYYDEESPRVLESYNFYYALEDLLRERLTSNVGWSVHRPGLLLGSSPRTAFNFMGSLCVYASICRHLSLPFVVGGARMCWEEAYIDASDARLVAQQHIWASTDDSVSLAIGEAFNAVSGSPFTWKEIWLALAAKFQVFVPEEMFVPSFTFSAAMHDKGPVWEEIVEKEGLKRTQMEDLANWWFMDAVFGCPVKILASRNKVERLGFGTSFGTVESILYWVDCMREEKLIP
ncbi:(S)-8-oxocitronellyl enol synthase CYC2 [Magnolia sinica]|uniref:(S)-8-oxocitronellyl enol synthase CYC2 n=1 Tax=Magnolia sinica TaxID=86752 RepID=UPI00265A2697|nr:(S)-8-oxocitronellyl enol synthase CYC2 [Magnolia sinica]